MRLITHQSADAVKSVQKLGHLKRTKFIYQNIQQILNKFQINSNLTP